MPMAYALSAKGEARIIRTQFAMSLIIEQTVHSLVLLHLFFKNKTSFFNVFGVFNSYNIESAFIDVKIMISTRKNRGFCFPYLCIRKLMFNKIPY